MAICLGGETRALAPAPYRATGYRMIKMFGLKNFRCFESAGLGDLRLVNIIVGRNASGKTALLEAIRLAFSGTPQIAWNLNSFRGYATYLPPNPSRELFEANWRPYFYRFDTEKEISTTFTTSKNEIASLRIFFDAENPITPTTSFPQFPVPSGTSTIIPLVFDREALDGKKSKLRATIQQQGQFHLEQGPELGIGAEFFPSVWQYNSQQSAQWFSQLSIANKEKEIVEAIRKEFGFITELSVQAPTPISNIYATISYLPEKMPVAFISSGINKFLVLMTAIGTFRGGAILVDEMENGLHTTLLPQFWETICRLAKDNDVQLFLTTHSWECLEAAKPELKKNPNDFSLIRLERSDSGSTVRQFQGDDLIASLEEGFDVR